MEKIKVGIIGGTGYTGVELLRLLAVHPSVEIELITSRSEAGRPVAELFPNLSQYISLSYSEPSAQSFAKCDLVFCATPNGIAMQNAPSLLEQGVRVIDLAADFRIKNISTWEQWYGMTHACPELVEQAVYGLPELNRQAIKNADIIANPGCYPTATSLGLLPLLRANLIDASNLIADVKSGVTGAGRGASVATLFSEVNDSFKAYAAAGHRHQPEISEVLSGHTEQSVGLTFIPHLVPMLRGIHATLYSELLDKQVSIEMLHEVFSESYENEPFVEVLGLGAHPETRSVKGSNMCRIAVHKATETGKVVVLSVIDNLTKGAAGQAVQNMNIMFGFPEQTALQLPAILP